MRTAMVNPRPPMESEDGWAHLTYFDTANQLSFVWGGGLMDPIEVSHGGYGEPVIFEIRLERADYLDVTSQRGANIIVWFGRTCVQWVAAYEDGQLAAQ